MKLNTNYANATAVLPSELVAELQKYYSGMLWVPAANKTHQKRHHLITTMHQQGMQTKDIANLSGVTPRRVNQIIANSMN